MATVAPFRTGSDDPRRLRELLERSLALAREHEVPSVVVGVAGREGDLLVPDMLDYLESSLRVEDAIFRMTRERAVLFIADVESGQARGVMERFLSGFRERYPAASEARVRLGYFEVGPHLGSAQVRDVLPAVFPDHPAPTRH